VNATVDRRAFERALTDLRFDDAESMLEGAADGPLTDLRERLAADRARAQEEAGELHRRVLRLGEDGDHASVLDIQAHPTTSRMLALLSDAARDRAELTFRIAERWGDSQRHVNARRLNEARKAFDSYDVELARGLIARLDDRFLDGDQVAERDDLLLALSARSMELEDLRQAEERLTGRKPTSRRPWWRRRGDR
jgi:hypothetical protein